MITITKEEKDCYKEIKDLFPKRKTCPLLTSHTPTTYKQTDRFCSICGKELIEKEVEFYITLNPEIAFREKGPSIDSINISLTDLITLIKHKLLEE